MPTTPISTTAMIAVANAARGARTGIGGATQSRSRPGIGAGSPVTSIDSAVAPSTGAASRAPRLRIPDRRVSAGSDRRVPRAPPLMVSASRLLRRVVRGCADRPPDRGASDRSLMLVPPPLHSPQGVSALVPHAL
ncbi:hypothetical protein Aph02nite_19330 [Actinoplanes philippinensis]|nr:hypothetical protein Aph02nite_19330 [Actinoplanes philippinensis]